jgi:hypothetical protein
MGTQATYQTGPLLHVLFFFCFDDCISEYELKESGLVYSSLFHYILRKKKNSDFRAFFRTSGILERRLFQ